MDWWSNDAPESKRVCPFRKKNCCGTTFDSYRQMLTHCRHEHPDKPPFGGDPTTELVMTDNQGKVLSWEEVGQMLDHLSFLWLLAAFDTAGEVIIAGPSRLTNSVCKRMPSLNQACF